MITKLTPAQEAAIPKFVAKWIDQAQQPTNRSEATVAIKKLYKRMDEDEPLVIFGRSPNETILLALMVMGIVKDYDWSDSQLRSQLYSQLRSQLDSQLYGQLDSQLYGQLDSENDTVVRGFLSSIKNTFYEHDYWLVWCGWYEYGQYIGMKFDKELYDLFLTFNKNVGFTITYTGIVFMSDRPTKITWDNQRLHNDNGMAVEFKDGYGVYSLHGVNFNKELYESIIEKKITYKDTLAIKNSDQRAVTISMLGKKELVKGLKAKLVDSMIDEINTELYMVEEYPETGETEYFMWMKDWATDREFIEWVEPEVGKEHSAAWAQASAYRKADGTPVFTKEEYIKIPRENRG